MHKKLINFKSSTMKKSIKFQTIGFLPVEQVGKKLKFYSNKIYKSKANAQRAVTTAKLKAMQANLAIQQAIVAKLEQTRTKIAQARTHFQKYCAKIASYQAFRSIAILKDTLVCNIYRQTKDILLNISEFTQKSLIINMLSPKLKPLFSK